MHTVVIVTAGTDRVNKTDIVTFSSVWTKFDFEKKKIWVRTQFGMK